MKNKIRYSILILLVSISNLYATQIQKVPISDKMEILIFCTTFFVGLLIGAFSVFLFSKQKIYKILSKEKYKYIDDLRSSDEKYLFTYIGLFSILKKSKDEYKSKISRDTKNIVQHSNNYYQADNLKKEIEELKIQNKKLLEENIQLGEVIEKNKFQSVTLEVKEIEPEKKSNEQENISNFKYFTIPENDGSFKIASGKNNRESDCFYKIEVDKNGQKGKLYFISGDSDLRALGNINHYLDPVCEIENISNWKQANKIQLLAPGEILLSSDSWKIDINHKVKIKLL